MILAKLILFVVLVLIVIAVVSAFVFFFGCVAIIHWFVRDAPLPVGDDYFFYDAVEVK